MRGEIPQAKAGREQDSFTLAGRVPELNSGWKKGL